MVKKAIIKILAEFHGDFRDFDRYYNEGIIRFGVHTIQKDKASIFSCRPYLNEDGELYDFVDVNLEQGRNYSVEAYLDVNVWCNDENDIAGHIKPVAICNKKHINGTFNVVSVEIADFKIY